MKVLVLVKRTPDTETKIILADEGRTINSADTKFIPNPYDDYAVEEALQIKERVSGTEVVLVSFGPEDTKEVFLKGLAMGADRGLIVNSAGLEHLDALSISKVLAAVIKKESPDIVLCGKQGIDDDNMHVGPMVAELLGWPHVNVVNKLTLQGKRALVEREVEGGMLEVYDLALPALFGANKALNTPRFTSLPGIMKAKKKPLTVHTVSEFGCDPQTLKSGSFATIRKYRYPAQKAAGKLFKGEGVEEMVGKVAKLLREEANVL